MTIPNSFINLTLLDSSQVLMSYEMTVLAILREGRSQNNAIFATSRNYSSFRGRKDFLQVRLCVNGMPFRHSASFVNLGISDEGRIVPLSGNTAMYLMAGDHEVTTMEKGWSLR